MRGVGERRTGNDKQVMSAAKDRQRDGKKCVYVKT